MIGDVYAHGLEKEREHRRAGRAIDIVIAINGNSLALLDGAANACHRARHVIHEERIVQPFEGGAEKFAGLLEGAHAARDERAGNACRHIKRLFQFLRGLKVFRRKHMLVRKTPAVTQRQPFLKESRARRKTPVGE